MRANTGVSATRSQSKWRFMRDSFVKLGLGSHVVMWGSDQLNDLWSPFVKSRKRTEGCYLIGITLYHLGRTRGGFS